MPHAHEIPGGSLRLQEQVRVHKQGRYHSFCSLVLMAPGLPRPTREFAKLCRPDQRTCPTTGTPDRLLVQRENHVDRGVDFDRLTIEERRPIAPLPHRIERRLYQQWMPGEDFELLHRAILADNRVQAHGPGDARLPSQRRIHGLDSVDDHGSLYLAALLD